MSDAQYTTSLALPENTPAFLSRLRAGRFTSPAGEESSFLFDDLSRAREKKTSAHEIADSDTTILQDLGSSLHVFSMSVYFVGPDCDKEADKFYNSLFERYTPDKPGLLHHPRWGDRDVLPFGTPTQTETYTTGGGISRVTVEFRETATSIQHPIVDSAYAATIGKNASIANETALGRAKRIATSGAKAYSKFRGVVRDKVNTIKGAIDGVVGLAEDARAEVESIHQGILDALTLAATPAIVLAQINAMIETVVSIPQETADLTNQIIKMTQDVLASFLTDIGDANTAEDVRNTGITFQCIASACLSGSAIAAINVNYATRDQVGAVLDSLALVSAEYDTATSDAADRIEGNIIKSFDPDTDVSTIMHGVTRDTAALLLSRAFSLKSARWYTLLGPSDPMTETWTRYGDLEQLEFFCKTNKIGKNEFVELPAGRELVQYV